LTRTGDMEHYDSTESLTGCEEDGMTKIIVPLLPHAKEEYDQSQMAQLIQTLEQMILVLNTTYTPVTLSDEDEQKAWFLS